MKLERDAGENDFDTSDYYFRQEGSVMIITEANVADILRKLDEVINRIKEQITR